MARSPKVAVTFRVTTELWKSTVNELSVMGVRNGSRNFAKAGNKFWPVVQCGGIEILAVGPDECLNFWIDADTVENGELPQ